MTTSWRPFICHECRRLLRSSIPKRFSSTRNVPASASKLPPLEGTNLGKRRSLRLGIIGSGPAGFYAAARVMEKLQDARVDMFEKLPVPFGLVRHGVAPDHPEVKVSTWLWSLNRSLLDTKRAKT